MATNFPGSLDNSVSLPYPTALNGRNAPSLAGGQDNQNDALIAVETKLGTSASTPSGSNLLVSTGTGTSAWSKAAPTGTIVGTSDSQTLTNKILTSPTINSPTITNATLSADVLSGFTVSNNGTVYGIGITGGAITGANTVSSTALQTNAVQGNQIATNAITLGYAQITGNITTTSTTMVQASGLTSTVTIPGGNRKVKITAFASQITSGSSPKYYSISIWDGTVGSGTQLNQSTVIVSTSSQGSFIECIAVVSPSAGSKTYNVGWASDAGGGVTATMVASSTAPAFILVEVI